MLKVYDARAGMIRPVLHAFEGDPGSGSLHDASSRSLALVIRDELPLAVKTTVHRQCWQVY
jgi:hypothetical protein